MVSHCQTFIQLKKKAWMDTSIMLQWIEQVWEPWTATKNNARTMLILNEFLGHMTFEVRRAIADCGTYMGFVTSGYTSHLQVMDVGLNRPFKNHYRSAYNAWFMSAIQGQKHLRSNVSRWISESWAEIGDSVIENSWQKIGLPNPLPAVLNEEATMDEADSVQELQDDLAITQYDIAEDDDDLDEYPDDGHHHEPLQEEGTIAEEQNNMKYNTTLKIGI
jgi:hypothetical protein